MKKSIKKQIACFLLLFATWFGCLAQSSLIPTGTWRTHFTYHNARSLAIAEDRIYAASDNGLFYLDKAEKQTVIISKLDGLSGNQFSKIAYHKALKKLLITYRNGNVDILQEKNGAWQVSNIKDITQNNRLTNKQINHITLLKNLAYLSTDFGVVVIDMEKEKIFESYLQLGFNAASLVVYGSAVAKDSLFLATERGILVASLSNSTNRLDFRNWRALQLPFFTRIRSIASKNNKIYYTSDALGIFEYDNGVVKQLNIPDAGARNFQNLVSTADGQRIIACAAQLLLVVDAQNNVQRFQQSNLITPQDADFEGTTIWVADYGNGLINNASGVFAPAYPKGTYNAAAFDLLYFDNKILAASGAYNQKLEPSNSALGFYAFENGEWTNYNGIDRILQGIVPIPPIKNLVQSAYNAQENKVYFATWTEGILVWDIAKNTITTLAMPNVPTNQISALTIDRRGSLWVGTQSTNSTKIYKFSNGIWQGFALNLNTSAEALAVPLQLLADEANNIWVRFGSTQPDVANFLAVLNDKGQQKILTTFEGSTQLPGTKITCIELDLEGSIWIGTDKGIRLLPFAATAIGKAAITLSFVIFERRQLFKDEPISVIKTDGGNRKWIGTEKGAWLFSADGSEQLLHFTIENSPLTSNIFYDMAIHDQTGEVFFATNDGILSYRADATAATQDFASIKIFPNPVPPNFSGFITLEGLAENSYVKITDISGRLVFETTSNGGTAVWRGTDYNGRRANGGVYLVFCTNRNGEQSLVGKVAVID
jgi:ligand-binding sensor domain-containing protein